MLQTTDQRSARHTATLTSLLAALLGVCISGCGRYEGSGARLTIGRERPVWVQDLREPLQDLPVLSGADETSPPTPDSRERVGAPTDLSGPIGPRSEPDAAPGQTASGGGSGGVNVNIYNTAPDADRSESSAPAISTLEMHYTGQAPMQPERGIRQFGYDQIERMGTPTGSAQGPASADHIVSPGDELLIDITTDQPARIVAVVDSSGSIDLPDIGSFSVGGVRFDQLREHLLGEVSAVRRNFSLSVSLGRLASVPVRVVGEVARPGVIEAGPRPTLLDALGQAGIRKSGSLRTVIVNRANADREVVDLYQYLIGGQAEPDIRLSRGDSITVPPVGPTIGVAGSVQRPGIFEISDRAPDPTVDNALAWAGGVTGFALEQQIQIERTRDGKRVLLDVDPNDAGFTLRDGDMLLVGAVDGRLHPIVESAGSFARPGRFQFREGMTVTDLVRMSGGLTVSAFEGQAVLSRQTGAAAMRGLGWDAAQAATSRRVVIVDLGLAAGGDPLHDLPLEPLDHLKVVRFDEAFETPTVEIIGAVRRPGTFELTAGLRAADLIMLAGNTAPDAHRDEAELIRRRRDSEGSILDVSRYRINLASILNGESKGPRLETGDRLILRKLSRAEVRVNASGLVRFPGEYVLPSGSRVTDLIAAAGGVLEDGDLRGARFTRDSVRQLQRVRWDELAERTRRTFERNLERRVNGARSKEALSAKLQLQQSGETLDRLASQHSLGRIVLPLDNDAFPDSAANLALEPGDSIFIPRASDTVTIQGHVFNPITVVQDGAVTADDLISLAGGLTEPADQDRLYVVRANGLVEGVEQRGGRFRLSEPLYPGDSVLVPPKPLGRDPASVILDALIMARTAGEAAALWNLATSTIDEGSISIIDSPASQRTNEVSPAEILDDLNR